MQSHLGVSELNIVSQSSSPDFQLFQTSRDLFIERAFYFQVSGIFYLGLVSACLCSSVSYPTNLIRGTDTTYKHANLHEENRRALKMSLRLSWNFEDGKN